MQIILKLLGINDGIEVYKKRVYRFTEPLKSGHNIAAELERRISPLTFIQFISSFDFKNDTSLDLIKHGITQRFKQDYISAIHILVPQVEVILRALLSANGIIPLQ